MNKEYIAPEMEIISFETDKAIMDTELSTDHSETKPW